MPGRRTSTTTQSTPLEETEPTATPEPTAPSPVEPEPGTTDTPEPTADELDAAAVAAAVHGDGPETRTELEERIGRMIDAAMQERRPSVPNLFGWPLAAARSAAAAEGDYPLTVHEAITEVTRQIGAIEKTGRSTEGYRFRGIDQALAALHPILGDVGLVILPGKVLRESWETRATAKGGTLNVARLLVSYTLVGPDGTKLRAAAWGEGADSGDKATQKAHSQSYKTLVFQTFTIPTEASAEDEPDATNEAARPFTAEEVERAGSALRAADEATSLEELSGIRRRALQLLTVPVQGPGHDVAPLSWWFDQYRAGLEGQQG